MIKATYIGPDKTLQGKTTLVQESHPVFDVNETHVRCQFDDYLTQYAYGWHLFPKKHLVFKTFRRPL